MSRLQNLRVGYVPYSQALNLPGDRRRFVNYAQKRGIEFEPADPRNAYDVVVLSERADISVWRNYSRGKIVYDLIDSYLAISRTSIKGQLRGLAKFVTRQSRYLQIDHWRAIETMCKRADAVVCTTAEQQQDIGKFCRNVHVVLDLHSTVTRAIKADYATGSTFRLAWEGLPATLESLHLIKAALREIERNHPLSLHIVTDPTYFRHLGRFGRRPTLDLVSKLCNHVTLHEWNERTCAEIVCNCDAALIPLDLSDPFAAGKPKNKLLLLWRMGMPVVTSASPAYLRAMAGAGLDLACKDYNDWQLKLEHLIKNQSARENAGRRGRAYAESHFSEEQILARWDAVFASLF